MIEKKIYEISLKWVINHYNNTRKDEDVSSLIEKQKTIP